MEVVLSLLTSWLLEGETSLLTRKGSSLHSLKSLKTVSIMRLDVLTTVGIGLSYDSCQIKQSPNKYSQCTNDDKVIIIEALQRPSQKAATSKVWLYKPKTPTRSWIDLSSVLQRLNAFFDKVDLDYRRLKALSPPLSS